MENPNPTFEDSLQDLTYLMYLLVREPQFFSSRRQFMDAVRRRTSQMRSSRTATEIASLNNVMRMIMNHHVDNFLGGSLRRNYREYNRRRRLERRRYNRSRRRFLRYYQRRCLRRLYRGL